METHQKTPEKGGEIEDLSEEEQFLRKKVMQKSTRPVHQIKKGQKLSLVKNLL